MTTTHQVRALLTRAFVACGVPTENAQRTATILVLTEQWGLKSHGLLRAPYYVRRLRAGGCNPEADLVTLSDTGAAVMFDGDGGLGHWQAWEAASLSVQRARTHGVGLVSVRNSNHCGALGVYALPGLDADVLTLVFSNGPAVMPPWGGDAPVLSTSPLAGGVPGADSGAVVDLATSSVARGRIAALAAAGEQLPEGWALAADGTPTTDPQLALAGMLAPMGGAKGFALAFLVEALTGVLVGPRLSADVADMFDAGADATPQGISHTLISIDMMFGDVAEHPDGAGGTRASGGNTVSGTDRLADLQARIAAAGGRLPGAGRRRAPDGDETMNLREGWLNEMRQALGPLQVDDALLSSR